MDEKVIARALRELGIGAHLRGYEYITASVALVIADRSLAHMITKVVYPTVAKRYNTKASRVERSIRHAICSAWDSPDINHRMQSAMFGKILYSGRTRPTNGQFIATLADLLVYGEEI